METRENFAFEFIHCTQSTQTHLECLVCQCPHIQAKVVPNGALLTFKPNLVIGPIFNVTYTTEILPVNFLFTRALQVSLWSCFPHSYSSMASSLFLHTTLDPVSSFFGVSLFSFVPPPGAFFAAFLSQSYVKNGLTDPY